MISRSAIAVFVAATLAGCSAGGFGGSSLSDVDRVFLSAAGSWDTNHDGVVTCEEWRAYVGDLFASSDRNRDGFLDPAEFTVMTKTDRMFEVAGFKYFDGNNDGKIARAELTESPNPAFVYLDHKKDCQLTATELTGARSLLTEASSAPASSGTPSQTATSRPGVPGR